MNRSQKLVWKVDCLQNCVKMTRNQFEVFTWLMSRCNGRRETKCSARRLALKFNFSDAYAGRLLKRMEEEDLIEILRRGTGQRPNLYRLSRINLSTVVVRRKRRVVLPELAEKDKPGGKFIDPPSRTQSLLGAGTRFVTPTVSRSISMDKKNNNNNHGRERATHTIGDTIGMLRRAGPRIAMSKSMKSPFARFAKKKDNPAEWNAQDIVCYYTLLFRHVYGTLPAVNWSVEVGAARNILNYFEKDPEQAKHYLQIAFAQVKGSPGSLGWFTQQWVINNAIAKWDSDVLVSDYRDKDVLGKVV